MPLSCQSLPYGKNQVGGKKLVITSYLPMFFHQFSLFLIELCMALHLPVSVSASKAT